MKDPGTTRAALLDVAQELSQTRGLNAFSFKDLAKGVGISTASVHHHFATKEDLAREVMVGYRDTFRAALESIDGGTRSPRRKLERFAGIFRGTLRDGNRLCLCGMLATEYATLPASVKAEVRAFYNEVEDWLRQVLESGHDAAVFTFDSPTTVVARTFLSTLEGAMIAARTFGDERRLASAAKWFLDSIEAREHRRPS